MGLPVYVDRTSKGSDNPDMVSLPPDERPRPVVHKPKEEESESKKHWRDSEGNIAGWELKKIRATLLREGVTKREVAIVDTAANDPVYEKGAQKGMNFGELSQTMEKLRENAGKLGIRKEKLDTIQDAFEDRL